MALALTFGAGIAAANASVFNFDVIYTGGGNAVLAPGSDDMLGVGPVQGDTINYSITASGGQWKTIAPGGPSIFGALGDFLGDFGQVSFDYNYAFNFHGAAQSTGSGSGSQGDADIGPRQIFYASGMNFDNFSETLLVTSATQVLTFVSLLPSWPGNSPEAGSPDTIVFTRSGVPEPAAWALMILGFAGVGASLRRRPSAVAA
ncbi:MAG TPA: PEPxxWA-CTERM sorting domain-containing protein [Phenylobacterium sp.]|nr:PEPxxWA-CTERM sorting domain-containing protein [Phenylobacterium sp.]